MDFEQKQNEPTQSNQVCCFQTLDAVFLEDLFSDWPAPIAR